MIMEKSRVVKYKCTRKNVYKFIYHKKMVHMTKMPKLDKNTHTRTPRVLSVVDLLPKCSLKSISVPGLQKRTPLILYLDVFLPVSPQKE